MNVGSTTPQVDVTVRSGRQYIAAGTGGGLPEDARATSSVADEAAAMDAARQRVQQHLMNYIAAHDQVANFLFDKTTGLTIVQIINRSSGELVRQFPTEEVIRVAQYLESLGLTVNAQA